MAGDQYKKVTSGEPLAIPAETWNDVLDTTRAHRNARLDVKREVKHRIRDADIIYVKNATANDLSKFAILGIDGSAIPYDGTPMSQRSYYDRVAFDGADPTIADHAGQFVITQEPLAKGAIGVAIVSGVTVVKVNLSDVGHTFADVSEGNTGELASVGYGGARILSREGTSTGSQLAVVRLSNWASVAERKSIDPLGIWYNYTASYTGADKVVDFQDNLTNRDPTAFSGDANGKITVLNGGSRMYRITFSLNYGSMTSTGATLETYIRVDGAGAPADFSSRIFPYNAGSAPLLAFHVLPILLPINSTIEAMVTVSSGAVTIAAGLTPSGSYLMLEVM